MNQISLKVPPHIPPHLVYDFDHFDAPELLNDPQRRVPARLHGEAPPIFWTPRQGGYWVVTRAALALEMTRDIEKFSSLPAYNKAKDFHPPMLPIQSDPPLHNEYRRILNPIFAPGPIKKLEGMIRDLVRQIIDPIIPRGHCDFLLEIAEIFPVIMFLRIIGAPEEDRHKLVPIAQKYTRSPIFEERAQAIADFGAYLKSGFDARRDQDGDDLLSRVARGRIDGRALSAVEEEGLGVLLLLAGLDTVKSAMSFAVANLARHPNLYKQIVEDPSKIPAAVEELLRVGGVSTPERGATGDFEWHGVPFRKNDRIVMLYQLYGVDDQWVENPQEIRFDREVSNHLAFGSGPHRCIGSHLARLEFKIFLEEWTKSVPVFSMAVDGPIKSISGIVWSPQELNLVWPVSR